MSYKVSVIIPTYNAERFLKQTIKSIMNQTIGFENIELILVDDNSKDSTRDIIQKFSDSYSNIKYFFPKGNTGTPSRGRNIGIDNASSKYVMFLDQDDKYVNSICEVLFNTINGADVDIVMCNYKITHNNNFEDYNQIEQDFKYIKDNPKENSTIFNDIYMWNKIFALDFLKKNDIKCPEGVLSEDLVFCVKAYLNTDEIIYLNNYFGYLYNIRETKKDVSTSKDFSPERYEKLLEGFYKTIDLLNESENEELIKCNMKKHYPTLIFSFIRLNIKYKNKKEILNKLFDFRKSIKVDLELNEIWARIFDKHLQKRNFRLLILYSNLVNFLYNSKALIKTYRKISGNL